VKLPKPKYTVSEVSHKYSILLPNGETVGPLKSVTGILQVLDKPALVGWAAREAAGYFKAELLRLGSRALTPETLDQIAKDAAGAHRRKAKDAADLGTQVHALCEAIIKGNEPADIPAELTEPARDFKRWRMQSDIEIVALELPVASLEHRFGGRLDAVGYSATRGGLGIVDLKTSSGFYGNEYSYQVGGYAVALAEQYGIAVSWAEIVRFGKKPPYDSEGRPVTNLSAAIQGFLNAAAIRLSNAVPLIGKPDFCTKIVRAEEAATAAKAAAPKSKAKKAFPF
jgi:hypothetical protein